MRKAAILGACATDTVDRAIRGSLVEFHRRSEVLYYQGDASERCYTVLSGRVRISRVATDGREATLFHALSQSVFGEWGLYGHPTQRDTAEVAEDVRVAVTPLSVFAGPGQSDSKLLRALAEHAAARRLDAEARFEAILYRPVRSRLAEFLIDAARRDGVSEGRGTLIRSRYTHLEIACTVGATRETVTLTLSDMRRRGLLVIERRRIIVRDLTKLRALV